MVDNAPPSYNPVNDDTLLGTLREVLKKQLQQTDDMLPARVVAYDRTTNRAQVKPLIRMLTSEGDLIDRAAYPSIPVLLIGGGDFFLSYHLPPGSLGWIKANDRDISLFLRSYVEDAPNTFRLHTFEDAVFIPDIMTGYTIDPEDEQAAVLQNLDGTVRISLTDARVKVTSPQVEIVTGTSTVTVVEDLATVTTAESQINGNVTIDGTLNVTGNIDSDATITAVTDCVGGGISLNSHTHDFTNADGVLSTTQGPN